MSNDSTAEEKPIARQLQLREYKGYYVFDCTETEDYASFKCRDDDVWVCTFPRSGTTLTQQITYLIMTLDFDKATEVDMDIRFPYADIYDDGFPYYRGLKYLDSLPTDTPRLMKSHMHNHLLPDELKKGKGKIIYVTRHPGASVVSLFRLMMYICNPVARSLREFIETFLTDKDVLSCPWGLHVRQYWEHRNDGNVLFLQFENLVKNRRGTIKQIAHFLGRDLTDDQLDKVTNYTSIESMKSNKSVNWSYFEKMYKTDKTEGAFINKGEVSGWKNDIPEDLAKRVDVMIKRELGHTDINYEQ